MTDNIFEPEANTADPMINANAEGVQLPVPALFLSWRNGDSKLDELGLDNVKYTGGWELNDKNYEKVKDNLPALPLSFKPTTIKGTEGQYNAYLAKNIAVCPVGIRERSLVKMEGRDVPVKRWTKGSRQHIQMLAYMAYRSEQGFTPFGLVILSAKSNSAAYVKNTFSTFDAQTKDIRASVKVPYYRFYITIGTHGTPEFVTVGKNNQTHDITPCNLITPAGGWNMDELKARYIGREAISKIAEIQMAAAEWLNDKSWSMGVQNDTAPASFPEPNF